VLPRYAADPGRCLGNLNDLSVGVACVALIAFWFVHCEHLEHTMHRLEVLA